jgi:hypothetical protein
MAAGMRNFFANFWRRKKCLRTYANVRFVKSISEIPEKIGDDVYVVGPDGAYKWVILECPCFQGHRLDVNLMKSQSPRWRTIFSKGKLSLSPSVVVTDHPCQSHFWFEANQAIEAYFVGESTFGS